MVGPLLEILLDKTLLKTTKWSKRNNSRSNYYVSNRLSQCKAQVTNNHLKIKRLTTTINNNNIVSE